VPYGPALTRVKKVLIVEDDPDIIRLLKCRLEKENYLISVAMDGEEALQKTTQESPDLVLLDLGLPKLSGEEVCKAIRKDEKLGKVRIVMLTGKASDADRIVGRVIGADCYMTKPFDMTDLVKTLALAFSANN
jgi:DNA-binding response OmpR family regulator